jgi:hypothetical protein
MQCRPLLPRSAQLPVDLTLAVDGGSQLSRPFHERRDGHACLARRLSWTVDQRVREGTRFIPSRVGDLQHFKDAASILRHRGCIKSVVSGANQRIKMRSCGLFSR